MKSMFLKTDLEKAEKEVDCYIYCSNLAVESVLYGDYKKALAYHENCLRSLNALQEMKEKKTELEEVKELLNQMNEKSFKIDISLIVGGSNEKQ